MHRTGFRFALVFSAFLLECLPLCAKEAGVGELVNQSLAEMDAGNWEESLKLVKLVLERHDGPAARREFGPRFGAIHYRKGVCEMKLKRWNEAMESFEVCYRDFPNDGAAAGSENVFHALALLKWGEAAMGAGQWELALSRFKKFIEERDRVRDLFPHGVFYVSVAVCNYRLGRIAEGNENLEIAIQNKRLFPTPDDGIIAGFEALATAAISGGNEQALLDFIAKNRGELILEPYLMQRYARVFLKLAGDAVAADMRRAAMAIYAFVPSLDAALDDARARKLPEHEITAMEAESTGGNSPEMIRLAAIAYLHEKNGNLRGAVAAYRQLETCFPHAANREANRYNLIRTSSQIGESAQTRALAGSFLLDYPDSPRAPEIQRLLNGSIEP
jgi:tetratricopeptide (TPR) repeat protein